MIASNTEPRTFPISNCGRSPSPCQDFVDKLIRATRPVNDEIGHAWQPCRYLNLC